jgi:predicted house-cleaning noncanonical NTP pyrophosphatase (MazG superfamily)
MTYISLTITIPMDREYVYNWECPKCEEEFHAFVEDSDVEPFVQQVVEHMKEAHGMSEEEVKGWNPKSQLYDLNGMMDEIWSHHSSSVQISGKPDELIIR